MIREVMSNLGSLSSMSSDVAHHVENLIDAHLQLSKEEMRDKRKRLVGTILLFYVGSIGGVIALLLASFALVNFFVTSLAFSMAASLLIVAIMWAVISVFAISSANRSLDETLFVPNQTLKSLKENILWILKAH